MQFICTVLIAAFILILQEVGAVEVADPVLDLEALSNIAADDAVVVSNTNNTTEITVKPQVLVEIASNSAELAAHDAKYNENSTVANGLDLVETHPTAQSEVNEDEYSEQAGDDDEYDLYADEVGSSEEQEAEPPESVEDDYLYGDIISQGKDPAIQVPATTVIPDDDHDVQETVISTEENETTGEHLILSSSSSDYVVTGNYLIRSLYILCFGDLA